MYKVNKILLPKNNHKFFKIIMAMCTLGKLVIFKNFVYVQPKDMCICIDGPMLWNSFETILKEEINIHIFKHRYKQMIMESYIHLYRICIYICKFERFNS